MAEVQVVAGEMGQLVADWADWADWGALLEHRPEVDSVTAAGSAAGAV